MPHRLQGRANGYNRWRTIRSRFKTYEDSAMYLHNHRRINYEYRINVYTSIAEYIIVGLAIIIVFVICFAIWKGMIPIL